MSDQIDTPILSHLQFALLDIIQRAPNSDGWCPAVRVETNTGMRGPGFYAAMRRLVKLRCLDHEIRKVDTGNYGEIVRSFYRLTETAEFMLADVRDFYESRKVRE